MELSARDRRILAEIECESALEDPSWVRRFERLGRLRRGERQAWRRLAAAVALLCWTTLVGLGATVLPRLVLWVALGLGASAALTALWFRLRRGRGPLRRSRRRLPHIPRQNDRPAEGGDVAGS